MLQPTMIQLNKEEEFLCSCPKEPMFYNFLLFLSIFICSALHLSCRVLSSFIPSFFQPANHSINPSLQQTPLPFMYYTHRMFCLGCVLSRAPLCLSLSLSSPARRKKKSPTDRGAVEVSFALYEER
ncbi:hypothetical protein F5B17DRAFT_248741 [Nemania serpens]|nr:hypothetical protein F5B17DRAFT_248741 [Nemania serpens]